jgi:hypothetical protein
MRHQWAPMRHQRGTNEAPTRSTRSTARRVTGRGHMDVNRISGYIPGKIVFFLMQARRRGGGAYFGGFLAGRGLLRGTPARCIIGAPARGLLFGGGLGGLGVAYGPAPPQKNPPKSPKTNTPKTRHTPRGNPSPQPKRTPLPNPLNKTHTNTRKHAGVQGRHGRGPSAEDLAHAARGERVQRGWADRWAVLNGFGRFWAVLGRFFGWFWAVLGGFWAVLDGWGWVRGGAGPCLVGLQVFGGFGRFWVVLGWAWPPGLVFLPSRPAPPLAGARPGDAAPNQTPSLIT